MKRAAVFLDRDGVLVEEQSYIRSADRMQIYPFSKDCIRKLHNAGFLAIVITNQSGIARGYFTENELESMNKRLQNECGIDDIFYCPHYSGGIVSGFNIDCECRKPKIGMIKKACSKYEIDLEQSYFIGDRESDIQTGKNANITTILVRTGYGKIVEKKGVNPNYICDDLRQATDICIKNIKPDQHR